MCFTTIIFWSANEMETEKIIRLSVRNLVEFILKEGDIDNRISGTLDKDAMLMGGRLHRKIQRMMGSNYQAEVSLKLQLPCDGFQLKLEGRADGILLESEKTIIDEIKGVVRSLDRVERPVPRIYCMEYSSDLSLCRLHTICHITISVVVIYRETDYISCSTFIAFRKLFILQKTTDCILCLFDKKKSIPLNRTNCHFPVTRTDQYFCSSVNRTFLR